jgi:hypothetical protein
VRYGEQAFPVGGVCCKPSSSLRLLTLSFQDMPHCLLLGYELGSRCRQLIVLKLIRIALPRGPSQRSQARAEHPGPASSREAGERGKVGRAFLLAPRHPLTCSGGIELLSSMTLALRFHVPQQV